MNFFSRSSLATGPKIRVPLGVKSSLMITAAFSSKRMYDPSLRRVLFTVRTTTALTTSPFLTTPPGVASLTVATITSPILAYLLVEPPSTRIHSNSYAPVLSATLSLLSCCIMQVSLLILFHFFHNFNKSPSLILR